MRLNRKAIMVKFLVTVLLALIIFVPACIGISKLFRLSNQAGSEYKSFVGDIQQMDQAPVGERRSTLLILDSETAIVYFEPNKDLQVFVQGMGDIGNPVSSGNNYDITIKKPSSCPWNKACLCLLQESTTARKYKDNFEQRCAGENCGLVRIQGEATITPTQAHCIQDFQSGLTLKSCSLGTRHGTQGYYCSNGFMIERDLVQKTGVTAYYIAPRRLSFQLTKNEDTIVLEGP